MTVLLLDTHVFLWMQTEPERLGPARSLPEDDRTELMLSSASSWEIAIKWVLGKLPLPIPPDRYVPDRMQTTAVSALNIGHRHALAVAGLRQHHTDPFDRLLIAQATVEKITFVTADPAIRPYGIDLLWIGN